ncbi:MAG: hypothetical protein KDA25_12155 [Phycisphaerales bacterium]|nr:hypothetical protein [Phycisphaerales bacterium]
MKSSSARTLVRSIVAVNALIIAIVLGGCFAERSSAVDPRLDQPWLGPGRRATGIIVRSKDYLSSVYWIEWETSPGRRIHSGTITPRLEGWLRQCGAWDQLGNLGGNGKVASLNRELSIVSLHPTVVLMGAPARTSYHTWEMAVPQPTELTRGFLYGTQPTWSPDVAWFSPELRIRPTPVEFDASGVGRIPMPWGELVLRRDGDRWDVQAEAGGDGKPAKESPRIASE